MASHSAAVHSFLTSHQMCGGSSGNGANFFPAVLHLLCLQAFYHYTILIHHCLQEHVTALTRQNIVTSSVHKLGIKTNVQFLTKKCIPIIRICTANKRTFQKSTGYSCVTTFEEVENSHRIWVSIVRTNIKHTFDKNYAGETNKSKQFSEKPKYLKKLLLHKKMWNKTTVSWLCFR